MANNNFLTLNDYKRHATESIEKPFLDFLQLGSGANVSVNANEDAFSKYRIRPRYINQTPSTESCTKSFQTVTDVCEML